MTDPTQPQPQPGQPAPAAPFSAAEDKQYATLATFLNIIYLIPGLIFYLAFRTRGPMIAEQSKENLNWTINVSALSIICEILFIATLPLFGIGFIFGLLQFALFVLNLIFSIIGGTKLNAGQLYRYPVNIRWIK